MKAGWLSRVMTCGRLRTSSAAALLQRAEQHADALAGGREHQAAEAQFAVDAAHAEVRESLAADAGRRWPAMSLPLLPSGWLLKLKPGVFVGRGDLLVLRGRGCPLDCTWSSSWSWMLPSRLRSKRSRVLQAQLDAELVGVVQRRPRRSAPGSSPSAAARRAARRSSRSRRRTAAWR